VSKQITRRLRVLFQEIDLGDGSFVIGRSPSCDLPLEDPLVSRRHAIIQVMKDAVTISDLGSRNGTLINGEPLFDNYPLHNRDRIGIGNHELLFIEERRGAARPPSGVEPEARQLHGGIVDARVDDTITLQMGGAPPGMVTSYIDKAMQARRFDRAARLLEGKLEDYEVKAARGVHDIAMLAEIAPLNARLATELRDGSRLAWIVSAYTRARAVMSETAFAQLLEAADGWYNVAHDIEGYLNALESGRPGSEPPEPLLHRMREIARS
jgi:hypothetical protein